MTLMKILTHEEAMGRDNRLLQAIKQRLPRLEEVLQDMDQYMEAGLYRFYDGSFKIFGYQEYTDRACVLIREIALELERPLCDLFVEIAKDGTGHSFSASRNENWASTRPIVEALMHAHYFMKMMVMYGRALGEAPERLPFGWAAILVLFEQRASFE